MKLFIKSLLFIMMLVCMSGIFMFSSQTGEQSNNISSSLTKKITETKVMDDKIENYEAFEAFNTVVRKYAHFMMFFMLGLISSTLALLTFEKKLAKAVYPLLLCLVWAVIDEVHQVYVPGRNGQLLDVLIDFGGALLATAVVAGIAWAARKKFNKSPSKYF